MSAIRTIVVALFALAVLFVGFAWWVWLQSAELHWGVPVAVTCAVVLLTLLLYFVPRLKARRAAQQLERELQGPAAHEPRSAEIDRMRREFEEAILALKNSRLRERGGDGRDTLSVLPWYAIIGPPACGKTTALRRSGLRFPHVKGTGQRPNVKGLGGTRNLDWFLTDDAILIDTAGRWSVEGAGPDRHEWEAFLRLIRKYRPHKPLNGVILAVSLAEQVEAGSATLDDNPSILSLRENEVRLLADRMRERLEEISGELGVRLPVYVLFTKCDLLHGFAEMFGDMDERARRQVWGFNARVGEAVQDPAAYFGTCLEELAVQLERRALTRLGEESESEVLERIFGFPDQFRALRDKLCLYLEGLVHDSAYSEAPMLRGVYFTCGTQEGAPAQAAADALAHALRIREPLAVGESRDESYFLYDMLKKVVFADQHLATASDAELLRQKRLRRTWTMSVTAISTALLLLSATSYAANRRILNEVGAVLEQVETDPSADALVPLYEQMVALERGRPTLLASVFYQGNELIAPLREHFARGLQRRIVRELYADNTARLKEIVNANDALADGEAQLSAESRQLLTRSLELHLLLGRRDVATSKECPVPSPVKESARISKQLLESWEARQVGPALAGRRAAMLSKYLELLSPSADTTRDDLLFNVERAHVARARRLLGAEDAVERALAALTERYAQTPLPAEQLVSPAVIVSRERALPGEFQPEAWRRVERDIGQGQLFAATAPTDCWILGGTPSSTEDRNEALASELRQRYAQRYAAAWQRFVGGLSTRSPSSLADAEALLALLPEQLSALFQQVKEHTLPLSSPASPTAEKLVGKLKEKAAKVPGAKDALQGASEALVKPHAGAVAELRAFTRFGAADVPGTPTPLDTYRLQLAPVMAALTAIKTDPSRIIEVKSASENALNVLRPLVAGYGLLRTPLEKLVLLPLEQTRLFGLENREQADQEALAQAFCSEVYALYRDRLRGRFPFKRDHGTAVRAEDVANGGGASLEALNALLKPKTGALWTFVEQKLAGLVVADGSSFRFGERDGRGGGSILRQELLPFLKRARALRDALFSDGESEVPRLRFEVVLLGGGGIAKTRLWLGGEEVAAYDNGERDRTTVSIEWPGKDPSRGVELQLDLDDRSRVAPVRLPGPWGLFLLADGTGCHELQGSVCKLTGRCDHECRWYGDQAAESQRICGGRACYWGLNSDVLAVVRERTVDLRVPVRQRTNVRAHLQLIEVGDAHPLTDFSVFDLRVPTRITTRSTSACGDD